jgi:hypothetical protein
VPGVLFPRTEFPYIEVGTIPWKYSAIPIILSEVDGDGMGGLLLINIFAMN